MNENLSSEGGNGWDLDQEKMKIFRLNLIYIARISIVCATQIISEQLMDRTANWTVKDRHF